MKKLRQDLGGRIKPQWEPPMPRNSPWDCLLDEVSHIASNVKTRKSQNRIQRQRITRCIRQEWQHNKLHYYHSKYTQRSEGITIHMNANLAMAQKVKQFWNSSFHRFNALKQEVIASEAPSVAPETFLDGIINVNLEEIANSSLVTES